MGYVMDEILASYYDSLAPYYKYIYQDWEESIDRQGAALHGVIREYFGENISRILDASCGIGTQTLGLAALGYQLTGVDISPEAIRVAREEAAKRKLEIDFFLSDMRLIEEIQLDPFDLIIACDNAVPHLLSQKEILKAFRAFYGGTTSDGGCLISVRDYSKPERGSEKYRLFPRKVHTMEGGRLILFDLWEFEGDFYQLTTYFLHESEGGELKASAARGGKYYLIETQELEYLFLQAGFRQVITLQDRFFQPLIVARK
jgi:SAM-dependent methyltransferase